MLVIIEGGVVPWNICDVFVRAAYSHHHASIRVHLHRESITLQDDQIPALHRLTLRVWAVIRVGAKRVCASTKVPKLDTAPWQIGKSKEMRDIICSLNYAFWCHISSKITYSTPADRNAAVHHCPVNHRWPERFLVTSHESPYIRHVLDPSIRELPLPATFR